MFQNFFDCLVRDTFTEAELDGTICHQAQRRAGITSGRLRASYGCDLRSRPTINALWSARTLLIMQCDFKSCGQIPPLDVIEGRAATRQSRCNLWRRHFTVKQMKNPSASLQTVGSTAGAKESFQRTAFFLRELNEVCVSSHCHRITMATVSYNNFSYRALVC